METVIKGVNFLAAANKNRILTIYHDIESKYEDLQANFKWTKDMFGKGDAARRIIDILSYNTNWNSGIILLIQFSLLYVWFCCLVWE